MKNSSPIFTLFIGPFLIFASTSAFAGGEMCVSIFSPAPLSVGPFSLSPLRNYLSKQSSFITDPFQESAEGQKVAAIIVSQAAGKGDQLARLLYVAMTESPLTRTTYLQTLLDQTFKAAVTVPMTDAQRMLIKSGVQAAITKNPDFKIYLQDYGNLLWGTTPQSMAGESNLRNYLSKQSSFITDPFQESAEGKKVAALIVSQAAGNGEQLARLLYIAVSESPLTRTTYLQTLLDQTFKASATIPMTDVQRILIKSGVQAAITKNPDFKIYLQDYGNLLWGTTAQSVTGESNLRNYLSKQNSFTTDPFLESAEGKKVAALIVSQAAGNGEQFARLLYVAVTESPLTRTTYLQTLLDQTFQAAATIPMTDAQQTLIKSGVQSAITKNPDFKTYLQDYGNLLWGS